MGKGRLVIFNLGIFLGIVISAVGVYFGGKYIYSNVLPKYCESIEEMFEDELKGSLNEKLNSNMINKIDLKYVTFSENHYKKIFTLDGNIFEKGETESKVFSLTGEISEKNYATALNKISKEYDPNKDLIYNYNIDGLLRIRDIINDESTVINNFYFNSEDESLAIEYELEKIIIDLIHQNEIFQNFDRIFASYVELSSETNNYYMSIIGELYEKEIYTPILFKYINKISINNYELLNSVLNKNVISQTQNNLSVNHTIFELSNVVEVLNDETTGPCFYTIGSRTYNSDGELIESY